MKRIFLVTIFLIGGLLTVLGSGVLTYEVLKPASKPLPKDVKTLLFVYRNISFGADSITRFYQYNDETFLDTADYKKQIAGAAYEGFRSIISKHYPLDTIPLLILPSAEGNAERSITPMDWGQVDAICEKNKSDILVSLDDVTIFNNYITWYDGLEYNGIADISAFHSWTIYDPLSRKYLLEEAKLDSLQVHKTSYGLERLLSQELPHREEIMKIVAFSLGEKLAKKLVPQWETVYREYYSSGNRAMRTAANKVKTKKWEEALAIWEAMPEDVGQKHKARAAFNRAIVFERIGKLDDALVAIQQSINIYKATGRYETELELAETLKMVLEKRQKEITILRHQQAQI